MNNWLRAALFILIPLMLAVSGGAVWGLVDWLRNYGSGIAPFPYFDHSSNGLEFHNRYHTGTIFGIVEESINWYNLNFRGGTRFGSGLGLMAGAFVSMGFYNERPALVRSVAGVVAGAEIGGRFVLNLGSGVPLFLIGTTVGAIIGGLYMGFAAGSSTATKLPTKELAQIP